MSTDAPRLTREQVEELAKAAGLHLTPEQMQQLYEEASELLPRLLRIEQSSAATAEPDLLHPLPAPPPVRRKRA